MTTATYRQALSDGELAQALGAYWGLRCALVSPDTLNETTLRALRQRVLDATEKYPDNADSPAQNASNAVLRAYADYLAAVIKERCE